MTAGLDSAVLGESEIQGQVKQAWDRARDEGAAGPALNLLFRHALEAGKRARTETGIARNIASVSQAAVAMAAERLGGLAGKTVLVLGAGDMGEGMAVALAGAGRAPQPAGGQPHAGRRRSRWPPASAAEPVALVDVPDRARRGRPAAHLDRFAGRPSSSSADLEPVMARGATAARC